LRRHAQKVGPAEQINSWFIFSEEEYQRIVGREASCCIEATGIEMQSAACNEGGKVSRELLWSVKFGAKANCWERVSLSGTLRIA
jgi:hypothetical protein